MHTRTIPVSFEELLGFLVQERVVAQADAKALVQQEERQFAMLSRKLRASNDDGQAALAVTPIELLLSFDLPGADGQPLKEDFVTEIYANKIGLPYEKLDPLKLDAELVTSVLSKPFARKHNLLAIEQEASGVLKLATCNPFDRLALEAVERVTGKRLRLVVASKSDIQKLIVELYGFQRSVANAERDLAVGIDLGNLEQLVRMKSDREIEASDQHVVNAVEYLFAYAFRQRASDIHIEPKRVESVVRFRIDGSLHPVNKLPRLVHNAVVNRIKTLARLDIGEKRRPQDGRIKTAYEGKEVEIRISTLPVAFGEKLVLRIFDPDIVHDDLARLGFFERELLLFDKLIHQPNGIVLVTGPTGSGKTTTLYTALRNLATDDVNISTIEDPIEMVFERVNQTAVNPAIGLGFAEALRTLLRQDPDILMVGEIRDLDTARNAVQAALTGHLVFSTLHTNDAPSAVTRLLDLGVQSFLLASTLTGLIAQRLVKKVCDECAEERALTPEQIETLGVSVGDGTSEVLVRHGRGCVECRHSGYRGRSAIYEMFEVNDAVKALVMQQADSGAIKKQAQADGMLTLREAAVRKMALGVTSFEEVLAVT